MNNSLLKQVPMNLLTNMGVFIFNIIINLFMTPFYIKYLGIEGLGIVRLALLLPVYVNLATLIITGAVSRFLTIDLQGQNYKKANYTFNTSFFSITTILIITIPLIVYFALHITSFLNIPDILIKESSYLFFGIFISSQITVFSTLFLIPAYANNRLDVQNIIKIVTLFIQTSVIICAFIFISPKLHYVSYAYIGSTLIGLILSILIWEKFAPFLYIDKSFIKLSKLKEITSMGSWLIINQMGSILFLSVDLIIINHFFGTKSTGDYSIVLQWSLLLRSLAGIIAGVLAPIILISYAKKSIIDIVKYSKYAIKYIGIIIAIPVGLIIGFSSPLFTLWLGNEFVRLTPLLWLVIGTLPINLSVLPLFSINTAFNKVKIPGMVSLGFGIMNLLMAILLSVTFNMGIYGVALASAIVLTLKNIIFTPLYSSYILRIDKLAFIKELKFSMIILFLVLFLSNIITHFLIIDSWSELLLAFVFIFFFTSIAIWFLILDEKDKIYIKIKFIKNEQY